MDSRIIYVCPHYEDYEFKTKRIWRTDGKYEPFVYIIQEVETEMMYIGSRTKFSKRHCLESDLGTIYFTSSTKFDWRSNPSSFEICKVIPCASNHDALILESILIAKNHAVWDNDYYNRHEPSVGYNMSGHEGSWKGKHIPDEIRKKISDSQKGERGNRYGKPHTDESRKRMSENHHRFWKGKKHTKETRMKISEKLKEVFPNGNPSMKDKKHTEESKRKMSESTKGENNPMYGISLPKKKCQYCGKEASPGMHSRWHGDNCKHKPRE